MVAWYWVVVAYIVGQLIAMGAFAICAGHEPRKSGNKYIK